jgi:hypothetical protein
MKPTPAVVAALSIAAISPYVPHEALYATRLLTRKPKVSKYPAKGPPAKPTVPVETRQSRRRREREEAKKGATKR